MGFINGGKSKMNLRDLNEKRALLIGEMRQITEKPAGTGGDLSSEQSARFDGLRIELDGVEKGIERRSYLDALERRAVGERIAGSGRQPARLGSSASSRCARPSASMVPDLAAADRLRARARAVARNREARRSAIQGHGDPDASFPA